MRNVTGHAVLVCRGLDGPRIEWATEYGGAKKKRKERKEMKETEGDGGRSGEVAGDGVVREGHARCDMHNAPQYVFLRYECHSEQPERAPHLHPS